MFRTIICILVLSIQGWSCLDNFESFISGVVVEKFEAFTDILDVPNIESIFDNDDIDPDKILDSIKKIKDKQLQEPVRKYIDEVDEITKINALYQIETEKSEVGTIFDSMSGDISKLNKYKKVTTENPQKMEELKEKLSTKSLAYAKKSLQKEDQKQQEHLKNYWQNLPLLRRGKTSSGNKRFVYNGSLIDRRIDIALKKEYITFYIPLELGYLQSNSSGKKELTFGLSEVLKNLKTSDTASDSVTIEKSSIPSFTIPIEMEVRTTRKGEIKELVYKGKNGTYAVFSVIKGSDIQKYNNWGSDKLRIGHFLQSAGNSNRQDGPNFSNFPSQTADVSWHHILQFGKKNGNWNQLEEINPVGTYKVYSNSNGLFNEVAITTKGGYYDNFLSDKGYELLWMNLSCCCYRRPKSGSAGYFAGQCSDTKSCNVEEKEWWQGKKPIQKSNTTLANFTPITAQESQILGAGTSGVTCGTVVSDQNQKPLCKGKITYNTAFNEKLLERNFTAMIYNGPLISIHSAPYMLALRWHEFFDE